MARLRRDAEEVRELPEREAVAATGEQTAGEPHRVEHCGGASPPRQLLHLAIQEGDVEARVVRDERRVAREVQEAAEGELDARRAAEVLLPDARQGGDERRQGRARVDERLERVHELERADPDGPDLAHPAGLRGEPRRLEVEDDQLGVLEWDVRVRIVGETDAGAEPGQPRVAVDDLAEEGARERCGRALEREEDARRLLRCDRAVACLHELDEPVRRVERELHPPSLDEHMFDLQPRCQTPPRVERRVRRSCAEAVPMAPRPLARRRPCRVDHAERTRPSPRRNDEGAALAAPSVRLRVGASRP
jgi:hypothetical protein